MFLAKLKIQILKEKRQSEFLELHESKGQRVGNVWWIDYRFAKNLTQSHISTIKFSQCPEISINHKTRLMRVKHLNVKLELCPDLTTEFILNNPKYEWNSCSVSLASHPCITPDFVKKHCISGWESNHGKIPLVDQVLAYNPNFTFEQFKSLVPETSWYFYARNPGFTKELMDKYPKIKWSKEDYGKVLPPEYLGSRIDIAHPGLTLELYEKYHWNQSMDWIGCLNPKLAYQLIKAELRIHIEQDDFLKRVRYGTNMRGIDEEYDQLLHEYQQECAKACADKWLNNCLHPGGRMYFRQSLSFLQNANPEKAKELEKLLDKRWTSRSQKKKITKEINTLLELDTISVAPSKDE